MGDQHGIGHLADEDLAIGLVDLRGGKPAFRGDLGSRENLRARVRMRGADHDVLRRNTGLLADRGPARDR